MYYHHPKSVTYFTGHSVYSKIDWHFPHCFETFFGNSVFLNVFSDSFTGDRFGLICAKVGLAFFVKHYKVEKCEDTPVPLILNPKSPFMMPIEGLKMRVKRV